ncbi:MAG: hypothetical protein DMF51_02980 [Acidobacteria bacterium]|nr:MAG: hypothetical protein DMF51_02980 [Acidobacteriota bacterium]
MTPTMTRQTRTRPKRANHRATPPEARAKQNPGPSILVVGLTGPNASGKGEVAKFLAAHGFSVFSLSDAVREEATLRGLDHSRDNLIRVGVEMRSRDGSGALARSILPRLERLAVVDSIRNPGEVEVLRTLPRFLLLGVDAPQPLRFQRSARRGRPGDGATLEEFARKEVLENSGTEAGQQLLKTLALADLVVCNDQTIAALHVKVRGALRARRFMLHGRR